MRKRIHKGLPKDEHFPEMIYLYGWPKKRPHGNSDTHKVFLRLNNRKRTCYRKDFLSAGYPSAIPLDTMGNWENIHKWARENLTEKATGLVRYSWFGSEFFFVTQEDCDKFEAKFGSGGKRMFAMEYSHEGRLP